MDGAVASCTEGQYLPRFLPPTPANRAQLYAFVGQTLEISINTEATLSRSVKTQQDGGLVYSSGSQSFSCKNIVLNWLYLMLYKPSSRLWWFCSVSNLWFSGPHDMVLTGSGQGPFTLRWTPSQSEDGEHHPACFVAQATLRWAYTYSKLSVCVYYLLKCIIVL